MIATALHPVRGAHSVPQPEDVFLSWLIAQPRGSDLASSAAREIRRLGAYSGSHPGPKRLGELFEHFVAELQGVSAASASRAQ